MASLFADSPDTPGKRLVYDTPDVAAMRRKTTTDGGSLSLNRVRVFVTPFRLLVTVTARNRGYFSTRQICLNPKLSPWNCPESRFVMCSRMHGRCTKWWANLRAKESRRSRRRDPLPTTMATRGGHEACKVKLVWPTQNLNSNFDSVCSCRARHLF